MKSNIKKNLVIGAAAFAVASVAGVVGVYFASNSTETLNLIEQEDPYALCSHYEGDNTFPNYAEPIVKNGKYYLNGDVNEMYYEVTDNSVITLKNADYEQIARDAIPQDGETDETILQERQDRYEAYVVQLQQPRTFTVKTFHLLADRITLDGASLHYADENTLDAGSGEDTQTWIYVE